MSRRTAVALGVAAALLLVVPAAPAADPPNAADLEAELVCPVCETTLDQSTAPVAERMKLFIRQGIAAGDTEQEIKDALVAEFGPGVLASPGTSGFGLLAWIVPFAALAGGAVALALLIRGWSRQRGPGSAPDEAPEPAVDPDLERRLDEELARLDG